MSDFTRFMKKNKTPRTSTTYAATKSLLDENGEPLLWTIRPKIVFQTAVILHKV